MASAAALPAVSQKHIEQNLLRHAKDFIPQMVEFKLSQVINGGDKSTQNKPVFPDSPAVGSNYVPNKLKRMLKKLEKGGDISDNENDEGSQQEEEVAEDYILAEKKDSKKKSAVKKPERDHYIPLNVYDLYEQANPRFANTSAVNKPITTNTTSYQSNN